MMKLTFKLLNVLCLFRYWIDVHTGCAFFFTFCTCLIMKLTFELLNVVCFTCCWIDVHTVCAFSFIFFHMFDDETNI